MTQRFVSFKNEETKKISLHQRLNCFSFAWFGFLYDSKMNQISVRRYSVIKTALQYISTFCLRLNLVWVSGGELVEWLIRLLNKDKERNFRQLQVLIYGYTLYTSRHTDNWKTIYKGLSWRQRIKCGNYLSLRVLHSFLKK